MKALVLYGSGGDYGFEANWHAPIKEPGWAIVRVAYSGICGSDIPRFATSGSYHYPMILGHEFSGIIDTPPKGSTRFKKDDPVSVLPIIPCGKCEGCLIKGPFHCTAYQFIGSRNDGGFAELCAVPENNLFPLPSAEFLMTGALTEPISVGLHTVRRSGFKPGKSAIIFGAGPIGLITGIILKDFGVSRLVIAELRENNLKIAASLGIGEAINPEVTPFDSLGSFDYAFEVAGSSVALVNAISLLSRKGTLTIVGRDTKDTEIPLKSFELMMRKELDIKCCWGYDNKSERELLTDLIKNNSTLFERLVTHVVTLEESPEIIRAMYQKKLDYCKVLIKNDIMPK